MSRDRHLGARSRREPPSARGTAGALLLALTVLGCSSPARSTIITVPDAAPRATPSVPAPTATPTPTPTPDPAPELPPIQEIPFEEAIVAEPDADWVSLAAGVVWVAGVGDGIGRFDPDTGEALGAIRLPGTVICLAMDTGFGAVWAGDCNNRELLRVEAHTGELTARIPLPAGLVEEGSVAVGDDGVWLLQRTGPMTLVGIDPSSNSVVSSIPAPTRRCGCAFRIRIALGHRPGPGRAPPDLADQRPSAGRLHRSGTRPSIPGGWRGRDLDPRRMVRHGHAGGSRQQFGEWPRSLVSEIPVDGGDIAVGGGAVWARVSDSLVARNRPATTSVTQRIGRPAGSGSVAADNAADLDLRA